MNEKGLKITLDVIKTKNPFCVFANKINKVKQACSRKRKSPFHKGQFVCTFLGSKVKAEVAIESYKMESVKVSFVGDVKHRSDSKHARYIREAEREELRENMKVCPPS